MQNQIPKNWQKVKLGDVADDIREPYSPKKEEHLKYIGLEHIEQGTLRLNGIGDSADTQSIKKSFKENDVLFGTLRAYFRKVVKPKFSGVCSTDIAVLRTKDRFDQDFLFYFIANPYFIKFSSNPGDGTRMPRAKWDYLSNTEWVFPEFAEQKKLALVLSSLDEKIEVNNKIAKNLEQITQTIFKELFVKNSEFENRKLNKLVNIVSGYPFSSKLYVDDKYCFGVVTIRNVQDGDFITECDSFIREADIPKNMNSECLLNVGDILLSLTGNVGRVCFMYGGKYLLNQRVAKLKPIDKRYSAFCYFLFRQPSMQNQLINMAKGSAQPNLSPVETGEIEFPVPPKEVIYKFGELANPVYERLVGIKLENQRLAQMRDLLLPKLMKGEIKV